MLDTHLSSEQVHRYQQYTLTPEEIVDIYTHLEQCDACCARVRSSASGFASLAFLEADLLLEALHEPEHLSDAEISATGFENIDIVRKGCSVSGL